MNVHLYADSQGRSANKDFANKDHKLSCMVKPGARFKDVVSESDMAGFSGVIVVLTMLLDIKQCTSFYLEEKI